MSKRKEKSAIRFLRFVARVWVVSMPAAVILAILAAWQKISWATAGLLFLGVLIFTTVITTQVFKELENFISYLKKLAQGIEIEPPNFKKGIFSSFRLADTFLAVKKIWSNQTLSDSTILENLPEPMLMFDGVGRVVFINQKAQHVFGADLIEQKIDELFQDEKIKRNIVAILANKQATEVFEWGYQSYTFQVRIDRLPALTRNGAIAVITMTDITPFKRFRKQQSEFFANANHELKTPLSIISGMIETLQGAAKNDEAVRAQFLELMAEQTGRMTRLVQDLLRLSREQSVACKKEPKEINVAALIQKLLDELQNKAKKYHKKFSYTPPKALPALWGNPEEVGHIFQNLIDNAIKYGAEKTVVSVGIKKINQIPNRPTDKRGAIVVAVHNQGNPIAQKDLDKLFDRFYRVDSTIVKKVEGTGLGLSIVQQLVQEYDGVINVVSTERAGTTFTVYLPVE